ncbi:MAG: ribose 5-phosphate isomerase B [Melioribacteraceae bacterium]|nr:ribose 5-phosphate isomerase B [Melioribacteraceae bacterium]
MKKVITDRYVRDVYKSGSRKIEIGSEDILTPLAKDTINDLRMSVVEPAKLVSRTDAGVVAIGSDHTGFKLKEILKNTLQNMGIKIIDVGTFGEDSCDYPDFAVKVANKVITGKAEFGIMLDATGIPSAITANKIPGIRAATCYNEFTAWSARNHNNANLMVLGAKTIGEESAKSILNKWMNTKFEGGRHQNRLDKITMIEKQFSKNT